MPDRSTTAGHQRTRNDHATETAEDYVEAIADLIDRCGECRVTELSALFGVSHVTVVRTVKRLEREGLCLTRPYRPIELTSKGRKLAQYCKRRHEIVYEFLLAIGVSDRVAKIDSEGIEHHVSRDTLRRFERVIAERMP